MKPVAALLSALVLGALGSMPAWAAETAPAATKPDLAKGEAISTGVCVSCHASDGSRGSPANPIIQGQHADYLV